MVTLDAIFQRDPQMTAGQANTRILADEFYILFRYSFSAGVFSTVCSSGCAKYNAFIRRYRQNVDEILRYGHRPPHAGQQWLAGDASIQAATDREELAKTAEYFQRTSSRNIITNVPAGRAILAAAGRSSKLENSFRKIQSCTG